MNKNSKGKQNMLVDRRNNNCCGVVLSPEERRAIFKESDVFDFHLPEIAGNFLPYVPEYSVLHIYHVDGKLSLTIVGKTGLHSWVRNPKELLYALTNATMKYGIKDEIMDLLTYKAPTIYRLLKLKLVTANVESTQNTEAV